MDKTSNDITFDHYQCEEVKKVIQKYCQDGSSWRALNGDSGWYKPGSESGKVMLRAPEDYDDTVAKYRTLYSTLDLFEPAVKDVSETWNEEKGTPENPIGTFKNCVAYTLSVDIDSIKGQNGEDIRTSPEIKKAVEAAGQFFVKYLADKGISKSVHVLYSGGGIYVHIHHALFRAKPEWTADDRDFYFRKLTMAFNALIQDIAFQFFDQNPEHKGRVKFDCLNNQKRKFKTIFSIHKSYPFIVIPLDAHDIHIDFEKAKLPLPEDVLASGERWYQDYSIEEQKPLLGLLQSYVDDAEDELKERKNREGSYEVTRSTGIVPREDFPPCIANIITKAETGKGPHRAMAVLAAYLYQMDWSEEDAKKIWEPVAERAKVEDRIFDVWYGHMICPGCKTIQKTSSGYPRVGLGGLGYCEPNEKCSVITWPGKYDPRMDIEAEDEPRSCQKQSQSVLVAETVRDSSELFHDQFGESYARVEIKGYHKNLSLDSSSFKNWLIQLYHEKTGNIPSGEAISQAASLLKAQSITNGQEVKLDLRVTEREGAFWYDLNNEGQAVRVTSSGWEVIDDAPAMFKQFENTASQVNPASKGDLGRLLDFVNIKNRVDEKEDSKTNKASFDWDKAREFAAQQDLKRRSHEENLFLIWLVACLVPDIPHPQIAVSGEKGAAKSTLLRIARRLVDPAHQDLLTMPNGREDFALQLSKNYMLTYDNLSKIEDWQSDLLCSAITGGGITKRKLYTNAEEVILSFQRCIGINGINQVATKPDLIDRSLLFELERIPENGRKEEQVIWMEFEEARPAILAGMFDALAKAMEIHPDVSIHELPRMADFCRWGYAIAEAIGVGGEEFLTMYKRNIKKGNEEAIQDTPVATAIVSFMGDKTEWKGQSANLLRSLTELALLEYIDTKAKSWPKAANALVRRLKQIKSNLESAGIKYSVGRDDFNRSLVTLRKTAS